MSTERLDLVLPVKVPWMVSRSLSNLQVVCDSADLENPIVVRFEAFFGSPGTLERDKNEYQKVRVTFQSGLSVNYCPKFYPTDKRRLDNFDWNEVPEFRDATGSLAGHQERFRQEWERTSHCPDPAMYEIHNSQLLKAIELDMHGYKHFLILGGDINVEVIAKDYMWESEGPVNS